ncbi:MAG: DUF951 family protein [Chloroflexi bacterium]|nr:DUF951 family protein [Chloroflexota bacterium]
MPVLDLSLGDVVELRKRHACGGTAWRVVRLGADIGITCLTCNQRVLLDRFYLERRIRKIVRQTSPDGPAPRAGTLRPTGP